LLECAWPVTLREVRDHAMVAMLIGCGLRRGELLALTMESVQRHVIRLANQPAPYSAYEASMSATFPLNKRLARL
jgi:integrase